MKAKLKTQEQFVEMLRNREIDLLHVSDDGEFFAYATKTNPAHVMRFHYSDFGQEFAIIDAENIIRRCDYEDRKIFFEGE